MSKKIIISIIFTAFTVPVLAQGNLVTDYIIPKSFQVESIYNAQPETNKSNPQIIEIKKKQTNYFKKKPDVIQEKVVTNSKSHDNYVKKIFELNSKQRGLSLISLIKNFQYDYSSTMDSAVASLVENNVDILFYDTEKGQIQARLQSGKEIFILLLPFQDRLTYVRITPCDGDYNFSKDSIDELFRAMQRNLAGQNG
jgi:hypothetical protein